MIKTTLCYLEKDDMYLMINKNKRKEDLNKGKWLGLGGHFEENETPYQCVIREVKEESGLDIYEPCLRGKIYFINDDYQELMYLFTVSSFVGELVESDEGTLSWIKKDQILTLNIWEGDKVFLELLMKEEYFEIKLFYKNDRFVGWERI